VLTYAAIACAVATIVLAAVEAYSDDRKQQARETAGHRRETLQSRDREFAARTKERRPA
jgi:hypothetical protein